MQRIKCGLTACLTVAVMFAGGGTLRAEVAACTGYADVRVLILAGITEGPDPIPQVWEQVRDEVEEEELLNPDGSERGDGRPDIATDPQTGTPHVVWAYNVSDIDYDIAYSTWTGTQWLSPVFLTSTTEDEIDPRVYVSGDAMYVVWWVEDPDQIFLSIRPQGQPTWSTPEQVGVTGDAGRRPSVVEFDGTVMVAAEKSDGMGGSRDVLVSTEGQNGFTTEVVATSPQGDPLNVILHADQGKLWMDWRDSDSAYAYTVFDDGEWTTPILIPWTADDWIAREEIRLVIRNEVLSD